jgi:hypothetical protein
MSPVFATWNVFHIHIIKRKNAWTLHICTCTFQVLANEVNFFDQGKIRPLKINRIRNNEIQQPLYFHPSERFLAQIILGQKFYDCSQECLKMYSFFLPCGSLL